MLQQEKVDVYKILRRHSPTYTKPPVGSHISGSAEHVGPGMFLKKTRTSGRMIFDTLLESSGM